MPDFTICYRISLEGTVTVSGEDLDDAKGRVEKTSVRELMKTGDVQHDSVDVDDGWAED